MDEKFRSRFEALVRSGDIVVDPVTRTVRVRYDSLKLSVKNLEFAIAKVGFAANEIPADPGAVKKLPAECRP